MRSPFSQTIRRYIPDTLARHEQLGPSRHPNYSTKRKTIYRSMFRRLAREEYDHPAEKEMRKAFDQSGPGMDPNDHQDDLTPVMTGIIMMMRRAQKTVA
jgi:hypothetical protein